MKATIVNIGDELLIGQVVNTNASVMSRMLTQAGIDVCRTVVVGDNAVDIRHAIDEAFALAECVLLTGGLGPTKDDITKHLLCEYFASELVEDPTALANVQRIFAARGYELTPVNRAQALVPRCCTVLNNDTGTAPCMWFEHEGKVLVSMPGVPFEMEWLMHHRVVPKLQERFNTGVIVSKNILVQGIGESFLSDLIEPWELSLPSNLRLAYLPKAGMVKLRITGRVQEGNEADLRNTINQAARGIYPLAAQYIVGEDSESLEEHAHHLLTQAGLTLATAESCTGGALAACFTAQPGASAYFRGGVVAYSNEVKMQALGVKSETLAAYGAVSEQIARQMAEGVRQRFAAHYAIATTGIAGPDGGTAEKPVGTVWVALSSPNGTTATMLQLGSNRRQQNIERTVNHALAMLIRSLCHAD